MSSCPVKIYPTVEACQIITQVKCPETGCGRIMASESQLNLHLMKTHKKMNLQKLQMEKQYYCPDTTCPWNSSKYFKSLKNLRQHYVKVHSAKNLECSQCQKKFPSEVLLKSHSDFCGIMFQCSECDAQYNCYETLKTHGRRKKHQILEKGAYKRFKSQEIKNEVIKPVKTTVLLPKPSASVPLVLLIKKATSSDQDSQTFQVKPSLESKMTQVSAPNVSHRSQQTQTGSGNIQMSVETQTNCDFTYAGKKMEDLEEGGNQRSTNTQTDAIKSCESSCNTSFKLEDFEFIIRDTQRSSSGTQTTNDCDIYSNSTATHDSIHTDTSDLLTDTLSTFDANFFNCNIETQTDFMLQDELFSCDYYSNMYTQTCDDILSGLSGFSDIQTQTVFNEMLRSVESQTLMSTSEKMVANFKDMTHMETQTDTEFRQMLEIINS